MLESLDWKSWFITAVITVMIGALICGAWRPYHIFLTALFMLIISGIITPLEALAGFTNNAVLTVGALFVVAAGVHQTNLLSRFERYLLPKKRNTGHTLFRIMSSASAMSSFLNNTPIVAMFIPQLEQWAKKIGIPISKLLIPLSYAAIVGGTITLIGTSTNLIVSEMLSDRGHAGFQFFQLAWIGIPATVLVVVWFALIGHRFLPDRPMASGLAGNDTGATGTVAGLRKNRPRSDEEKQPKNEYMPSLFYDQRVFQGNVAYAAPLDGNNGFGGVNSSRRYGNESVATALQKGGPVKRITNYGMIEYTGMGIESEGSDNASENANKGSRTNAGGVPPGGTSDIRVSDSNGNPAEGSWRTLLILAMMTGFIATGVLPVHVSVILAAAAMVVTGVLHYKMVVTSMNFPVLLVIASALCIGAAMETTGLAEGFAYLVVDKTSGFGIVAILVGLYLLTNLLTELITNNAAAVLMIPIAISASLSLGIDVHAVAITVTIAASASFLSPIGYQTNLMVMDPGGYRFTDYFKAGFPVTMILMAVTVGMVTWIWV